MTYSPLAIKRRQVLADLYSVCDAVEMVPVHLDTPEGESELVAGYFTEYAGLKMGMFASGEFSIWLWQ